MVLLSFEQVLLSTASPPRYWGKYWAAIRLSHRPEPSGRVVRGGVDGLDSGGRHGWRFALYHTHRPQRRPYPICTSRSGNVRYRCGGGWAGPDSSWEGHSKGVCTGVWNWSAESCGVARPLRIPLMICPLHRTYVVVVIKTDELLCGGCKWVARFKECPHW